MSRTRALLTAAITLTALTVGGCTDDDPDPKPSPPSSSAPTSAGTTGAADPVEPTMPAEAGGTDAAAAEAFVKFYWEMVNYAQASGDVEGLRDLGEAGCAACTAGVAYLDRIVRQGGQIIGGVGTVIVQQSGFLENGDVIVRFRLKTTRQTVDFPDSDRDQSYPGGVTTINATVSRRDDGWRLLSWDVEG